MKLNFMIVGLAFATLLMGGEAASAKHWFRGLSGEEDGNNDFEERLEKRVETEALVRKIVAEMAAENSKDKIAHRRLQDDGATCPTVLDWNDTTCDDLPLCIASYVAPPEGFAFSGNPDATDLQCGFCVRMQDYNNTDSGGGENDDKCKNGTYTIQNDGTITLGDGVSPPNPFDPVNYSGNCTGCAPKVHTVEVECIGTPPGNFGGVKVKGTTLCGVFVKGGRDTEAIPGETIGGTFYINDTYFGDDPTELITNGRRQAISHIDFCFSCDGGADPPTTTTEEPTTTTEEPTTTTEEPTTTTEEPTTTTEEPTTTTEEPTTTTEEPTTTTEEPTTTTEEPTTTTEEPTTTTEGPTTTTEGPTTTTEPIKEPCPHCDASFCQACELYLGISYDDDSECPTVCFKSKDIYTWCDMICRKWMGKCPIPHHCPGDNLFADRAGY